MRAHTPPRPHHPHRPHPPWPAFPRHYTDLARIFLVFREYSKAANACPHPPAPSPPTPHHPGLATTHTWLHFLSVWRVFKGCQCVPTPPRALTTPPPWPAFPRHYTDLARISEYLKAANACPHPPAPSPPPPPTPGSHFLGV